MEEVGVPTYDELVVVVRKNTIVNHPDVVRRFVQALARGYESTRRNPQEAVANLVRASSGLDPKLQLASVRATLSSFFPSNPSEPWGWQSPTEWNAYGQWMLSHHLISDPNAVLDASTNELLAGQGL
jgi:putative hydroxymethylpyrimidine transport system substrate-binding protein